MMVGEGRCWPEVMKGNWTLQEGEDDVFMINNRTGKKFRIKMEAVE